MEMPQTKRQGEFEMLYKDFSAEILGLQGVIVTAVNERNGQLCICVELPRKEHTCPVCGARTSAIHDYRKQAVRDIPAFGKNVHLVLRKRRYRCTCGKRFFEVNTWLPRYRRMTNRVSSAVINELSGVASYTSVAKKFSLSVTTVQRIFDLVSYPKPAMPKVLAIDEFKGNTGGEKFNVILTDPEKGVVLDILPKRYGIYLSEYFSSIRREERKKTSYFVSDMWNTYVDSAAVYFRNADHVVDRFHWIRQGLQAFEEVRKQEQKLLGEVLRKKTKHCRFLLLKRYEDLPEEKKFRVDTILEASPHLTSAHFLKERLLRISDEENAEQAVKLFCEWISMAETSGLQPFADCAKTFHNWSVGIVNSLRCPYSNGFTEGCNNKIKILKRNAYGLRNFPRFRNRILHMFAYQHS